MHRISFVLERPEATTPDKSGSGIALRSINAFIAHELDRDSITAAYRARVGLAARRAAREPVYAAHLPPCQR
ncbi:hypothetical protein ACGFMM_31550 [Streptomyces sp. NPDC048604]|uniref:hypothetical protein n=1 Tax=Streptomyces sp. NPDC048604 TaxID=3365578 RepID=UPI003717C692